MPQKKILFIYDGSLSFVNQHVHELLTENFSDCKLDVFDIRVNIKQKKRFFLMNAIFFLWEYRADLLFRYKDLSAIKSTLFVTSYMQRKIKDKIVRMVSNQNYLFTFQTQSQYEASVPGVPHYIYTDHTLRANFLYPNVDYRSLLKPNRYLLHTEKKIYEQASLVFTYSKNIRDSLVNQYDLSPSKIRVIGVGYGIESPKKINYEKYHSKNILFVGVDWKRKGGALLVEAFKLVQKEVSEATLTIVGSSPLIEEVPNVNVVGRVPLPEVARFYERAAVFCMPSHREPFGLVYLEAMVHQLPVVGLPIGALPELITPGESGFLTQARPEALADRLIFLLQRPDLCQKMGHHGATVVQEQYGWDKVGERLTQYINEDLAFRSSKKHDSQFLLSTNS